MRYWEVRVRCGREVLEAVADLMTALAGGVAVDDPVMLQQGKARGDWDYCDLPEGDPAFATVTAYFPLAGGEAASPAERGARGEPVAMAALTAGLDRLRSLGLGSVDDPQVSLVDEEDWANAWKAYFHPFRVGRRFVVVPSWEAYQEQPGDVRLDLDPGMAFGTGTHPTTALCLEALEDVVRPGHHVLDVGCGSGILAIAAAKLGAGSVLAMDIDPVAVQVAGANVTANAVADCVQVRQGELAAVVPAARPGGPVRPGGSARPEDVDRPESPVPMDIIVSNIIADVIISLVSPVAERLAPGGLWLAGGILGERLAEVEAAIARGGFRLTGRRQSGGWAVVEARLGPPAGGGLR